MKKLTTPLTGLNINHYVFICGFFVALAFLILIALLVWPPTSGLVESMKNRKQKEEEPVASNSCDSCPPCEAAEDQGPDGSEGGRRRGGAKKQDAPVDEDALSPDDPNYKNLETIRQQRTVQHTTFLGEVSKIYNSLMLAPETSFCEHNKTNGGALQKQCSALTHDNCGAVSCCIWGIDSSNKKSQCMVGGKDGAMYSTDAQGNPVNIDTYYYQNKCYGDNCPLQKMKKMKQMKQMKQ